MQDETLKLLTRSMNCVTMAAGSGAVYTHHEPFLVMSDGTEAPPEKKIGVTMHVFTKGTSAGCVLSSVEKKD